MGEIVYVLFAHNQHEGVIFYGVYYSVEQAEECMKNRIKLVDTEGRPLHDEWIIMPQIVGYPNENTGDATFYNSEGLRRD